MSRPTYIKRAYSGAALSSQLNATGLSSTDVSFTVLNANNWVDIATGNALGADGSLFVVAVDYGTANEEKILCSLVDTTSGIVNVWTNGSDTGRGYDGSSPVVHAANALCIPVFSATEASEANQAVRNTIGSVVASGDLLYGTGPNALGRLGIGTTGQVLTANASGLPQWLAPAVPAVPYMLAQLNENTGTSGVQTVKIDSVRHSSGTSGTVPTLASNAITVHQSGLYSVSWAVNIGANGSTSNVNSIGTNINTSTGEQYSGSSSGVANAEAGASSAGSVVIPLTTGTSVHIGSVVAGSQTWITGISGGATFLSVTYIGPSS